MAQNNEGDRLGNLVEGLDEFLQGRYSVTFYCPYSRSHCRMFNSGDVKACILWAFFFTIIHQMIGVLRHDKGSPYMPPHEPEMNIGSDGSFQRVVLDMNEAVIINKNFANGGENLDSQKETLKNMHEPRAIPSISITSILTYYTLLFIKSFYITFTSLIEVQYGENEKKGDEEVESYILFNTVYGFGRTYILFLFCIYSAVHLIPGLFSILHDVFVRHVVAKNKSTPMLYGLFRFQRVRPRN